MSLREQMHQVGIYLSFPPYKINFVYIFLIIYRKIPYPATPLGRSIGFVLQDAFAK